MLRQAISQAVHRLRLPDENENSVVVAAARVEERMFLLSLHPESPLRIASRVRTETVTDQTVEDSSIQRHQGPCRLMGTWKMQCLGSLSKPAGPQQFPANFHAALAYAVGGARVKAEAATR